MEIAEAIKKVREHKDVSEKLEGKYLCSALSFLHEWTTGSWELNFYDKGTDKIMQVSVDEGVHLKSEGAPFKPTDAQIHKIDAGSLKISAERALEIGKEYYDKNYKSCEVQKLFFALHGADAPFWSISVITKHLVIVLINIDANDGKIIKAKVHNIFDKKS